jgi:hypothetical protein
VTNALLGGRRLRRKLRLLSLALFLMHALPLSLRTADPKAKTGARSMGKVTFTMITAMA